MLEDRVRVVDPRVFEREDGRMIGPRADRDQDHVPPELDLRPGCRPDGDRVGIDQGGRAPEDLDAVPVEVRDDPGTFALVHGPLVRHEVADGDLVIELQLDPAQVAIAEPREEERRLAQGLRGERPGVGRRPSQDRLLLDQGHRLAEVRRLRGPLLPRRPGADDDQVEISELP